MKGEFLVREMASLIDVILKKGISEIESHHMPHMPTHGKAYEGLLRHIITQDVLSENGINLYVGEGFVRSNGSLLPKQMDIVISTKPGKEYSYSGSFYYDIENVVALIESKKTLDKFELEKCLKDSIALKNFALEALMKRDFQNKAGKLYLQSHDNIQKSISRSRREPFTNEDLLRTIEDISLDCASPLYIVYGYNGYKTKEGLSSALIDLLIKLGNNNYNISRIPNIIVNERFSTVKLSSSPGISYYFEKNAYPLILFSDESTYCILKAILHKIYVSFDLSIPSNLFERHDLIIGEPIAYLGNSNSKSEITYVESGEQIEHDRSLDVSEIGNISMYTLYSYAKSKKPISVIKTLHHLGDKYTKLVLNELTRIPGILLSCGMLSITSDLYIFFRQDTKCFLVSQSTDELKKHGCDSKLIFRLTELNTINLKEAKNIVNMLNGVSTFDNSHAS